MKDGMELLAPRARMTGLVVRELDDEVLIYDLNRDKAHCLNRTAGLVWKHCNGQTTVSEITQAVAAELKASISQDVIWHALYQLGSDNLLEEQVSRPASHRDMTRRDMLLRVGVGAAALPVIASITAPTATYAAASCATLTCPSGSTTNCLSTCPFCKHKNGNTCTNGGQDCVCSP